MQLRILSEKRRKSFDFLIFGKLFKKNYKKAQTFYVQNIDKAEKIVYNIKVSVSESLLNLFKSEGREKENGRS